MSDNPQCPHCGSVAMQVIDKPGEEARIAWYCGNSTECRQPQSCRIRELERDLAAAQEAVAIAEAIEKLTGEYSTSSVKIFRENVGTGHHDYIACIHVGGPMVQRACFHAPSTLEALTKAVEAKERKDP